MDIETRSLETATSLMRLALPLLERAGARHVAEHLRQAIAAASDTVGDARQPVGLVADGGDRGSISLEPTR